MTAPLLTTTAATPISTNGDDDHAMADYDAAIRLDAVAHRRL